DTSDNPSTQLGGENGKGEAGMDRMRRLQRMGPALKVMADIEDENLRRYRDDMGL
ncbi:unnamed protein product, partial [Symbiodinium microadriaticum]